MGEVPETGEANQRAIQETGEAGVPQAEAVAQPAREEEHPAQEGEQRREQGCNSIDILEMSPNLT